MVCLFLSTASASMLLSTALGKVIVKIFFWVGVQYNCQCMLLVSSRWLTSYASKWGGGSKAVLASSGWLKIVLENSE